MVLWRPEFPLGRSCTRRRASGCTYIFACQGELILGDTSLLRWTNNYTSYNYFAYAWALNLFFPYITCQCNPFCLFIFPPCFALSLWLSPTYTRAQWEFSCLPWPLLYYLRSSQLIPKCRDGARRDSADKTHTAWIKRNKPSGGERVA